MAYYKQKIDLEDKVLAMPLILYPDNLSRRTLNTLALMEINTVNELFERENEYLYWFVKWLGKKSKEEVISFKNELLEQGKEKSGKLLNTLDDNSETRAEMLDKKVLTHRLEMYWKDLSQRTIKALNRAKIETIWDLLASSDIRELVRGIRWLGREWLSEIRDLVTKTRKSDLSPQLEQNTSLNEIITDKKILDKLSFNLINNIQDLWRYFELSPQWDELKFINQDEIIYLRTVYEKYGQKEQFKETPERFLDLLMFNLTDRDRSILNERCYKDTTLVEMWSKLGITRERVRQLEKALMLRFEKIGKKYLVNDQDLYGKFMNLIEIHKALMLPKDIHLLDFLWFKEEDCILAFNSLKWIEGLRWEEIEHKKLYILFPDKTQLSWNDLILLNTYVRRKLKWNNDDIKIEDIYYGFFASENLLDKYSILSEKPNLMPIIKSMVELDNDYLIQEDVAHRYNKKYKIDHCILEILKDYPDGLHFTEVKEKILEKFHVDFPTKKIHTHLGNSKNQAYLINIWLWTYTLKWSWEYSGEITGNVIFSILKDNWAPMSFNDLSTIVLKRKLVGIWTVKAALSYKNEFRFCTFKDGKIGLKEWWLSGAKVKYENLYDIPIQKAFEILVEEKLITKGAELTLKEIINIVIQRFNKDEASYNKASWNHFLASLGKKWIIKVQKNSNKRLKFIF